MQEHCGPSPAAHRCPLVLHAPAYLLLQPHAPIQHTVPAPLQACYNPPPGAPALVVLDLHTDATHGTFPEPAKAVMRRYRLDRVTGNAKVPK